MDAMSVTAAEGFTASGVHCGIKDDGAFDLAMVRSASPASAAAVFTSSSTAAAAVAYGRSVVPGGRLQALVIASGCANAGTGEAGYDAVLQVAESAASAMAVSAEDVLVCTTGPIGALLPVDLVREGLTVGAAELSDASSSGTAAARGILTTDSISKEAVRQAEGYVIGGMAKGAGMVRPDMATMLGFITTDAIVSPTDLHAALRAAVDITFNCLNIDGCQSTNDTVAIMASGTSGIEPALDVFTDELTNVCRDLAWQMASDAEGASRVVTMEITGATTNEDAREIGKSIADASIVRASFYGGDPNWGRLLAAAGASRRGVTTNGFTVAYEGVTVAADGVGVAHDETALNATLEKGDFTVALSVGAGDGTATIVTTDLTPEYVMFNSERT